MQGMNQIGFSVQTGQMRGTQAGDPVVRTLREQLNELKNQLNELSSDTSITAEEKMRKQQEIQQQITDLQNQIRSKQMEQKKETNREKAGSAKASGQTDMDAVISADSAVKNAEVQQSTAVRMEGRAKVLKSEIKQSGGPGGALPSRMKELERVEQTSENAKAAQMSSLGDAEQKIKDGAGDKPDAERTKEEKPIRETKAEQEKERNKAGTVRYGSDGQPVSEEKESGDLGRA